MKYGFDYINGREVPQTVIEDDFTIQGKHNGTVHVENGTLTIQGELHGTLNVQSGAKAIIIGKQHGTVIVEANGKLAGTLNNNGIVIVRGVFGGAQSGQGNLILEENGYIKQSVIKNGMKYYEW